MSKDTKSKHGTGKAFKIEVCDAIRHHQGEINVLESKRKIAFDDRDNAVSEKRKLKNRDSKEYSDWSKRHSDAVMEIDSLDTEIKWHRGELRKVVEAADSEQLEINFDPPPAPEEEDPKQLKLGEGEKPVRPVGKPGPAKPEAPDPSKGDGVDEHLNASVNELDIPPTAADKLIAAGLTTIGRVIAFIDEGSKSIGEEADLGENYVTHIHKAVKKFRTKHRKAMLEAERA